MNLVHQYVAFALFFPIKSSGFLPVLQRYLPTESSLSHVFVCVCVCVYSSSYLMCCCKHDYIAIEIPGFSLLLIV